MPAPGKPEHVFAVSYQRSPCPPSPNTPCCCRPQLKVLAPQELPWVKEKGAVIVDIRPEESYMEVGRGRRRRCARHVRVLFYLGAAGLPPNQSHKEAVALQGGGGGCKDGWKRGTGCTEEGGGRRSRLVGVCGHRRQARGRVDIVCACVEMCDSQVLVERRMLRGVPSAPRRATCLTRSTCPSTSPSKDGEPGRAQYVCRTCAVLQPQRSCRWCCGTEKWRRRT